jgi:hypothetical protein
MDYLLERLQRAGCDRVRVVCRPEKEDVLRRARDLGAEVLVGHPPTLAASVLLGLKGLPDDEVVLAGFPDSVWEPVDGFIPLRRLVEDGHPLVLGLFETADPWRGEVVEVTDHPVVGTVVAGIESRPARPRGPWIWGCLAARAGALRGLRPDEEVAAFIRTAAMRAPVPAVRLGRILDIGTPETLRDADDDPIVRAARADPPTG